MSQDVAGAIMLIEVQLDQSAIFALLDLPHDMLRFWSTTYRYVYWYSASAETNMHRVASFWAPDDSSRFRV